MFSKAKQNKAMQSKDVFANTVSSFLDSISYSLHLKKSIILVIIIVYIYIHAPVCLCVTMESASFKNLSSGISSHTRPSMSNSAFSEEVSSQNHLCVSNPCLLQSKRADRESISELTLYMNNHEYSHSHAHAHSHFSSLPLTLHHCMDIIMMKALLQEPTQANTFYHKEYTL